MNVNIKIILSLIHCYTSENEKSLVYVVEYLLCDCTNMILHLKV